MVVAPGLDEVRNGDPPTLDLYRNPSSRILVLSAGLLITPILRPGWPGYCLPPLKPNCQTPLVVWD